MRTRSAALLLCLVGAVAAPVPAAGAAPPSGGERFIVTLRETADAPGTAAEYRREGADIDFVYTAAVNGFAGTMSEANLGRLQRDGRVTRIERDGAVRAVATQSGATWGIDRIDQRAGTDSTYTYAHVGTGVTAYVVDTGIRYSHGEFGGRASAGFDAFGGDGSDCNGHGTHVAGTIGGGVHGVAKDVALRAVRVLDCNGSGTWSGVIAGLDWIVADHADGAPAVANMSLGGGANTSVDDAVRAAHADGVAVVVAAGNGNSGGKAQDACNYSPARVPEAITIGATTSADARTSWSNYGACVDWFAPGASITSAWHEADDQTNTISGTSMAAPHVAGVAALHLEAHPSSAAAAVRDALYQATTKGIVTSSKTANNHLLYSLLGEVTAEPTPTEPPPAEATTILLELSVGKKAKGVTPVTSMWTDSGDGTSLYDVYVNGSLHKTAVVGFSETTDWRGGASLTYEVCRAGARTSCSNQVTVVV